MTQATPEFRRIPIPALCALFFISGAAAVIYQLVWQRSLFRIYGTNSESVALVVTAFMLGLGLGSLIGGAVSTSTRVPLPAMFGGIEFGIGIFGWFSLGLFSSLAEATWAATGFQIGVLVFVAVLFPTLLMGSTLPILVAYFVRETRNVGTSVGLLYFVNTVGSSAGCLIAAVWLMKMLGQSGSVRVAACLNVLAGGSVLLFWFLGRPRR